MRDEGQIFRLGARTDRQVAEETVEPPASDVRTVGDLIGWLAARGDTYAYAFETPRVIRAAIDHAHVKADTA